MEEDVDQITELQRINTILYTQIASLQREIQVLRERITAAQIGITLLNRILEEHDRCLYNVRVANENLRRANEQLITLYNTRN